MRLRFTKMHGLGNDFVMLDGVSQKINLTSEKVVKIADRNFGIGCDQLLIVEPPRTADADFCYRIFNQDGGEVENCGNGARCFAVFVRDMGLTKKHQIRVNTACGDLLLVVLPSGEVTVNMGPPILAPSSVPFNADTEAATYPLQVGKREFEISAISMGNPHSVAIVDNVKSFPVAKYGPMIERHPRFPKKVNAGFMAVKSRREIDLRVFERGVGETLACGTGACAAVVAGILRDELDQTVKVNLPGGRLTIQWDGAGTPVMMTGPATKVFHGQMRI